jgi:putative iron-regulated protein
VDSVSKHSKLIASVACIFVPFIGVSAAVADEVAVLKTYADIALAKYTDALTTAKSLDVAVDNLIANPNKATLTLAREAWRASRPSYQQTEAYRFGNAVVDDWEGRVNAWPLDEGLIDYVDAGYGTESDENAFYVANVIANAKLELNGKTIDASTITPELLSDTLHEAGDVGGNVATGYHAIEFLLWGQDSNGTGKGAGTRPATDFSVDACTHNNCIRRSAYLAAASDLLVSDLEEMVANWQPGGAARLPLEKDAIAGIKAMFTGMGSLSYGEMAGQRMKLGLLLNDPEEEHDCFSDNTHISHLYDAIGIQDVYLGRYKKLDGSVIEGASLAALVAAKDLSINAELQANLAKTVDAMQIMAKRAETVEAYDQMIGEGNTEGAAVVQSAIDGLVTQTKSFERAIAALGLGGVTIEGSDSLDKPEAVFQ